jgi:hypothetical protein
MPRRVIIEDLPARRRPFHTRRFEARVGQLDSMFRRGAQTGRKGVDAFNMPVSQ